MASARLMLLKELAAGRSIVGEKDSPIWAARPRQEPAAERGTQVLRQVVDREVSKLVGLVGCAELTADDATHELKHKLAAALLPGHAC